MLAREVDELVRGKGKIDELVRGKGKRKAKDRFDGPKLYSYKAAGADD